MLYLSLYCVSLLVRLEGLFICERFCDVMSLNLTLNQQWSPHRPKTQRNATVFLKCLFRFNHAALTILEATQTFIPHDRHSVFWTNLLHYKNSLSRMLVLLNCHWCCENNQHGCWQMVSSIFLRPPLRLNSLSFPTERVWIWEKVTRSAVVDSKLRSFFKTLAKLQPIMATSWFQSLT